MPARYQDFWPKDQSVFYAEKVSKQKKRWKAGGSGSKPVCAKIQALPIPGFHPQRQRQTAGQMGSPPNKW